MANVWRMKTTVEIEDALLDRARSLDRRTGRYMRSLVEEGLRRCPEEQRQPARYELPDRSVGTVGGPNPLETLTWQDLRDRIYGGRWPCVYFSHAVDTLLTRDGDFKLFPELKR